mgnify:CR=1 FL=1
MENIKYLFKRKIESKFDNWFLNDKNEKSLLVKGLRQVGKTTLIKKYAEDHFKNVVYIDFIKKKQLKKVFDMDFDIDRITRELTAFDDSYIFEAGKTVIIFDEVQECAAARESVKYFIEDKRYFVIESGSLLGIKGYNAKNISVPVGFESIVEMYPLDFEEFLWTKKINLNSINIIKESRDSLQKVPEIINSKFKGLFKEYLIVGGMPAVIRKYLQTGSFSKVKEEQLSLLNQFKDDFGKRLNADENETYNKTLLANINKVFASLPSQLAKENNKFSYAQIEKKGRSKTFDPAIQWLEDYGLIRKCYNLQLIELPLEGNKNDAYFKLYPADIGLLVAMLNDAPANIINNEYGIYNGAIYEGLIADSLIKNGHNLYYYHNDNSLEIDFVIEENGKPVIIEVKAKDGNTKSANYILKNKEKYNVDKCYKFADLQVGAINNKITLPSYMAFYVLNKDNYS